MNIDKKKKQFMTKLKKTEVLDKLLNGIDKKLAKKMQIKLTEKQLYKRSGSITVDKAINSGLAAGRMIEIFGNEQSGKTTLTINMAKAFDRVLYIDTENGRNIDWMKKQIPDIEKRGWHLFIATCGEDAVTMVRNSIMEDLHDFIIIDSLRGMTPRPQVEGGIDQATMGRQSSLIAQFCRLTAAAQSISETILVLINHTTTDYNTGREKSACGKTHPFYCFTRIRMKKVEKVEYDSDGKTLWNKLNFSIKKNKGGSITKTNNYLVRVENDGGIEPMGELLDVAKKFDIISIGGGVYKYKDTNMGKGRPLAIQFLYDNPKFAENLKNVVYSHDYLGSGSSYEYVDEDDYGEERVKKTKTTKSVTKATAKTTTKKDDLESE